LLQRKATAKVWTPAISLISSPLIISLPAYVHTAHIFTPTSLDIIQHFAEVSFTLLDLLRAKRLFEDFSVHWFLLSEIQKSPAKMTEPMDGRVTRVTGINDADSDSGYHLQSNSEKNQPTVKFSSFAVHQTNF
jgi:hypothetical protein